MSNAWRYATGLMLLLVGCTRWQVQEASPASVVASEPSRAFLVKRTDGSQVQVREARIVSDSLVGVELDDPSGPVVSKRVAIPVADIKSLAVREADGVATTVLVTVSLTLLVVGMLLGLAVQGD